MFELPEYVVLAGQMNQSIRGKTVQRGSLGNSPHKFVWYNQTPQAFEAQTKGKKVGAASSRGRWLFLNLEPGYVLVFGECGGRILFHRTGEKLPDKYHMLIAKLHPKKDISALSTDQEKTLYQAIVQTVKKVIDQGGRNDEYTLFGEQGSYNRLLDKDSPKDGCPICGGTVEKIHYLGGSSYYCVNCQKP